MHVELVIWLKLPSFLPYSAAAVFTKMSDTENQQDVGFVRLHVHPFANLKNKNVSRAGIYKHKL